MGWAIDPPARLGVEVDPAVIRVIADWLKERGEEGWGEVLMAAADKLSPRPQGLCPYCTGELAVRAGALLWHVTCRRCGHSAQR